jgi:quercetin dioxygenase-like cupin family protein
MFDWMVTAVSLLGAGSPAGIDVRTDVLLETTRSWNNALYRHYPVGQPQATLVRIQVPANTCLAWHEHPAINVAYVEAGSLQLQNRGTGQSRWVGKGDAVAEMVDTAHRGCTGPEPVSLLVFYAGAEGLPLSRPVTESP